MVADPGRIGRPHGELDLAQQFQRIGGTLTIRGRTQPVLSGYVNGAYIGFTFFDPDGGVRSMRSQIDSDTMSGSLRFAGTLIPITGQRR
ncbi:MAG: hypothetical protein WKH97_16425 [Casimicrobiaceae bacterium]